MTKLGIMQGRLVPPEPGRFQSFPRARWEDEFALATQVPLTYIEWIYDLYGVDVNPLMRGADHLRSLIVGSNVAVRAICADFFMDLPFLRCSETERGARQEVLSSILRSAKKIGVERIVLPFVDASRIETADEHDAVVRVLKEALPVARETGIELHLETALSPRDFADLLAQLDDPLIKVNYDSGNSSSLGFHPKEEFTAYGGRIGSVHIKDRVRGGGTVPLGTGDADFPALFDGLAKLGYAGDITLQVARSEPGNEVRWARSNREFVARYWSIE